MSRSNKENTHRKNGSQGRARRIARNIKQRFRLYCESTTLHGFQYITARESSIVESVLWFVMSAAGIGFCTLLMVRMWANFSANPTMTTVDTTNPIWELPFPGVTICNNNKVYGPHADVLTEMLVKEGLDRGSLDKFFASLVKLVRPDKLKVDNFTAVQVLDILNLTIEELMYQLMQPCKKMLERCAWLGVILDCSKIFKAVKSREGFCCAFNYHYDLGREYGYDSDNVNNFSIADQLKHHNISLDDLPGVTKVQSSPGAGRDVGLAVALNVEADTYKGSTRPYVGASVIIHDAIDYPDIGAAYSSVLPAHVLAVSTSGTATKSANGIRDLPIAKRMCLFDSEMPGESTYSYQTCISECIYEIVLKHCGCLPFYHPSRHGKTRTCYLMDVDCILSHRRSFSWLRGTTAHDCQCLPQCTDMFYDTSAESVQISETGYDSEIMHGLNGANLSFVYVYFADMTFVEYNKNNVMNWDSLLASFGGIFGLCLGGSVMSIVELFYHVYHVIKELFRRPESVSAELRAVRERLPPASQVFVSVPTGFSAKSAVKLDVTQRQKAVYLLWSQQNVRNRQGKVDGRNVRFDVDGRSKEKY